jgi:hypothetical protein
LHVIWVDRDLMIPLLQVNPGEDYTANRLGGKILQVGKRIYVRPCYQVKLMKVAAGMPAAVHLLHNGPGKGAPLYDPVLPQRLELSLHRRQLFAIKPSKLGGDGRP